MPRHVLAAPLAVLVGLVGLGACSSSSSPGPSAFDPAPGPGEEAGTGASSGSPPAPVDGGVGAPDLDGQDPPSHGGTITFESIGKAGWYPSRRDPAAGGCDAFQSSSCCLAKKEITSDALTPWDEDLVLTLRGPMLVKQMAVYQPASTGTDWSLVSAWDERTPGAAPGLAFDGNHADESGFPGSVGTECLVNVSTSQTFPCGAGSSPYCPPPSNGKQQHRGWAGSKLFVVLAKMPHATEVSNPCSDNTGGNWYDAPWIGLSVGELVRAGSFVSCQCYAKDQAKGYLGDGCGQFNVFEVVNDNNSYKNLDVFSTNMIGYAGYVGEGPCGPQCDVSKLGGNVDLIAKSTSTEAASGAVSNPMKGPGAAFRRPVAGYRYFLILLDVATRTVQLAVVHPGAVPATLGALLPALPPTVGASTVAAVRTLRLPGQ